LRVDVIHRRADLGHNGEHFFLRPLDERGKALKRSAQSVRDPGEAEADEQEEDCEGRVGQVSEAKCKHASILGVADG
jgi:hypothetical protein